MLSDTILRVIIWDSIIEYTDDGQRSASFSYLRVAAL